jgi:hypothetical protein
VTEVTAYGIRIVKGRRYPVNFCGRTESAKVLGLTEQHGYQMVKWRIGWPVVGEYGVESLAQFWRRMVKL